MDHLLKKPSAYVFPTYVNRWTTQSRVTSVYSICNSVCVISNHSSTCRLSLIAQKLETVYVHILFYGFLLMVGDYFSSIFWTWDFYCAKNDGTKFASTQVSYERTMNERKDLLSRFRYSYTFWHRENKAGWLTNTCHRVIMWTLHLQAPTI